MRGSAPRTLGRGDPCTQYQFERVAGSSARARSLAFFGGLTLDSCSIDQFFGETGGGSSTYVDYLSFVFIFHFAEGADGRERRKIPAAGVYRHHLRRQRRRQRQGA